MGMSRKIGWMTILGLFLGLLAISQASAAIFNYDSPPPPQGTVGGQASAYANGYGYSDASQASMWCGFGISTRTSPSGLSHAGNTGHFESSLVGLGLPDTASADAHLWGDSAGSEVFSSQYDLMSGYFDGSHPWSEPYDWGNWTVRVLPTGLEVAGSPTLVTINAEIGGLMSATGGAVTNSSWSITTDHGIVMSGSDWDGAFSDTGALQFTIPLGSSFTMNVNVLSSIGGSGVSSADLVVSDFLISFGAQVMEGQIPEPSTLVIWSLMGLCWSGVACWRRRRLLQNRMGGDRQRLQSGSTRAPWPPHVRAAILEIIDRGCPR